MDTRILTLLVVSTALLGACGSPAAGRPLEGAPVSRSGPTLALSPETESTPSTPETLGQQPQEGINSATPAASPSPPAYVIVATDGAGVNLRTGPSLSAPTITTLAEGTLVDALEEPVSAEGRSWRRIRSGDREGWVVSVVVRPR